MLSALLRPFKGSSSRDGEPADVEQDFGSRPSVAEYRNHPHATADFTEADDDDDEEESIGGEPSGQQTNGLPNGDVNDPPRSNEFLPLFTANANHLGMSWPGNPCSVLLLGQILLANCCCYAG